MQSVARVPGRVPGRAVRSAAALRAHVPGSGTRRRAVPSPAWRFVVMSVVAVAFTCLLSGFPD